MVVEDGARQVREWDEAQQAAGNRTGAVRRYDVVQKLPGHRRTALDRGIINSDWMSCAGRANEGLGKIAVTFGLGRHGHGRIKGGAAARTHIPDEKRASVFGLVDLGYRKRTANKGAEIVLTVRVLWLL